MPHPLSHAHLVLILPSTPTVVHHAPPPFQHPLITELNERSVRLQFKDQIDRMKRKELTNMYDLSGSDEEGGSMDPPTIKKPGGGCGFNTGDKGRVSCHQL